MNVLIAIWKQYIHFQSRFQERRWRQYCLRILISLDRRTLDAEEMWPPKV